MTRTATEHRFDTHDGTELFYRHWRESGPRLGTLLLMHRGHEHGARMAHLVDELDLPGYAVFVYDARGHGHSPGARGDGRSVGTLVRDLDSFVAHLSTAHAIPSEEIVVIAQSVGAVIAAAWAHDFAPRLRGLVLASPAFQVKLYVPFARTGLRMMRALRGNFFVTSYVKARFLTHDPERIASYESDPLITRPISVDVLLGLYDTAERIVADATAIHHPVQMLISGADFVVHHAPQYRFYAGLPNPANEKLVFPGFFHDTLGERDRAPAVSAMRAFIEKLRLSPPDPTELQQSDRDSFTAREARELAAPLSGWSPRSWWWSLTRLGLRVGSLLSRGLALGEKTGYDSGSTLDYVYRDQAEGSLLLGRLIDRQYLNSVGWRGIRVRKQHVEELLCMAMQRLAGQQRAIHVVDVAAGHGRYVLDALRRSDHAPASIRLRDYSEINVRAGQQMIDARGLENLAHFEQGDAFDRHALAALHPAPTLAVISGLFELFGDNALIMRCLQGLADAMPEGSHLVYTGQPWHPQLELIARALTSHRAGSAWVMRRRSQAELDDLVRRAGFRKITQRIDEAGIFTVSLAERVRS